MRRSILGLIFALAFAAAVPALAQSVEVSFDADQGGDWRGKYGECFFLLPEPMPRPDNPLEEIPFGPDWFSTNPDQYDFVNCYGGELFDIDPNASDIDWRLYDSGNDDGDISVKAFKFPDDQTRDGAAQWLPCRQDFWHGTWDNDVFSADPINVEIELKVAGDYKIAYYFADADVACRSQDWVLYIDDVPFATSMDYGSIVDFASGKYVVFDITDLPAGSFVRIETEDTPGFPFCESNNSNDFGVNSHISGVLINCDTDDPCDCDCDDDSSGSSGGKDGDSGDSGSSGGKDGDSGGKDDDSGDSGTSGGKDGDSGGKDGDSGGKDGDSGGKDDDSGDSGSSGGKDDEECDCECPDDEDDPSEESEDSGSSGGKDDDSGDSGGKDDDSSDDPSMDSGGSGGHRNGETGRDTRHTPASGQGVVQERQVDDEGSAAQPRGGSDELPRKKANKRWRGHDR